MFLNELSKEEGIAFINLVNQLATIDNVYDRDEKRLIKDYAEELNISQDSIGHLGLEEVISQLKASTDRIKRILYFELVGVALVDGNYDEKEIDFLDRIALEFEISRYRRIAFANYFYNFKDIYTFSTVEADSKIQLLKEQAESIVA